MEHPQSKASQRLKRKLDEKIQEAQTAAKIQTERLEIAINAIAETEDGRHFLRYLKDVCNFNKSKLAATADSRTIDPITTTVNAAKETVWLNVRKYLRQSNRNKIEKGD